MNRYAIIEAPSILGLKPTGVDRLPTVLLQHGLADQLHARRAGRVVPTTAYDTERDSQTLTLNAHGIAEYSIQLADAVTEVVERDEFPVLLGGDCSILLGSTLALRRRGRYGLLFIDGHADFYQPEANPNGEAASMDLAFATGRGPELLTNLEGLRPLVRDEDVVVFGFRDAQEQREYGSQPLPAQVLALDLPEVRRLGAKQAAQRAVEHLTAADRPYAGLLHSPGFRRRQRRADARGRLSNPRRFELGRAAHGAGNRARIGTRGRYRDHDLQSSARCGRFERPRAGAYADQSFAGLAASDSRNLRASRWTCFGGMRASAARSPRSSCFAIR